MLLSWNAETAQNLCGNVARHGRNLNARYFGIDAG